MNQAVERGEVEFAALARGHYPGHRLASSELPGLKTVGYWDAARGQQWGLDWHRNEGLEVTFCERGKIAFAVDSQEHVLQEGDLTVTRPWQLHRVGNPNVAPGRLHWLILDVGVRRPNQAWRWPRWLVLHPDQLSKLSLCLRQNERCVWSAGRLRACFERISEATSNGVSSHVVSQLAVAINDLVLQLTELLHEGGYQADSGLTETSRAVELFLKDLAVNSAAFSREWSVEEMAATCGLGKTQFVNHCRQLTNRSPAHYLSQCRLEAAAMRLRTSKMDSVTDVAFQCGFSSSQYFATAFQRHFGCSPRDYRHGGLQS